MYGSQEDGRIPVHYGTTKSKIDRLDSLAARLMYGISLINDLVTVDTKLGRPTLRKLVRDSVVVEKAKLSAGYIDQCIDKVLWSWRSYADKYGEWKYGYGRAVEDLIKCGGDEREKAEKKVERLEKNEPSTPKFQHKVSCRLDYRTGTIQHGENTFSSVDACLHAGERRHDGRSLESIQLAHQAARWCYD